MASKLETGYECNFVSESDDALKCRIYLAVTRDPLEVWQAILSKLDCCIKLLVPTAGKSNQPTSKIIGVN